MTDKMIDEMYSSRIHTSISIMAYPRQNPTFNQLKAHYAAKGIILNDRFADSLGLLTTDGRYNFLAYLLADENDMSMKVAKYAGTDKCDLLESTEYGHCCLITATNRILERMAAENVTMTKITYPRRIERKLVEPEPLRPELVEVGLRAVDHDVDDVVDEHGLVDFVVEYPRLVELALLLVPPHRGSEPLHVGEDLAVVPVVPVDVPELLEHDVVADGDDVPVAVPLRPGVPVPGAIPPNEAGRRHLEYLV